MNLEIPKWQQKEINQCIQYLRTRDPGQPARLIEVQVVSDKTIKEQMEQMLRAIPKEDTNYIAIVYALSSRPLMEKLTSLREFPYNRVFFHGELLLCPLDNVMVPLHELCTTEEVDEILEKYSIHREQLPKIPPWDPIVRWMGWQKGDIIRITRVCGGTYYRMVF